MKFKCLKVLLTGLLLSVVLLGNVANAALITFELFGQKAATPTDVFTGFVIFDMDVADDVGENTKYGIVDFQLNFTGSHNEIFTLDDLVSAWWMSIEGDLFHGGGGEPWITFNALNATGGRLTANVFEYQDTSFNERYRNVTATSSVSEPATIAILVLGMIGLATRRFKKQS